MYDTNESPGLAIAKGPILTINKDEADKYVFPTNTKTVVQVVGQLLKKGDLLLFGVPDGTGHLNDDEVGRALDAEEVWIIHEIIPRMLANDHEAIAFWCFQDLDKPTVDNVGNSGPILGTFPLSQINTCERHATATKTRTSQVLLLNILARLLK